MKKVLLTTVCGPFGADTDDCTRHVMPELFHAQVTRAQGIFSLRSTYISYGLEYIAKNITTPATVLQYPTMKQFKRELNKGYDYVGISFVIATFGKLKKMCKMVKEVSPGSKIILGGYGTMLPECDQYGDYICREEGVGFMRSLLGEIQDDEPKKHVVYPTRSKVLGFPVLKGAVVLAGLGCPHGCDFCATSHYHKNHHIPFLKTGSDLYREIRRTQKVLGNPKLGIGIIEEDFLLQKERADEYLDCVKRDKKSPATISCFASAYSASQWDPEDLVRMGIDTLWIGVESRKATYPKLKGIDVKALFETLHSHGINTLASLILGHDFHTVENVWEDFEYLVSLNPSLTQFLILTPACSTPLFERLNREGRLLDVPHKHWDGFHLVFDHHHIGKQKIEQLILDAYDEEYRRLGPSVIRYAEKQLSGYLRFRNSADPLLRMRAEQYRQGSLGAGLQAWSGLAANRNAISDRRLQQAISQQQFATQRYNARMGLYGNMFMSAGMAMSSRKFKRDIEKIDESKEKSMLDKLRDLAIYEYNYNMESDSAKKRIGVVTEEAPVEVVSEDGNYLDIMSYLGWLTVCVKQLALQHEAA